MAAALTLREFKRHNALSLQGICREMFREAAGRMRVQGEAVAVQNLTRILDATLALANQKGFAAMSLRELSARCGLSMGGLYAYIRSKEELAALIQQHGRTLSQRVLEEALQGIAAPRERLQAAIRTHLFLSETLRAWFYFSYMEAKHLGAEERQRAVASEQEVEALFQRIIEAGQQAGTFRACDAQLVASLLKALLQDWYLKRGKYRARGVDVERYAEAVIEMTERMLENEEMVQDEQDLTG
jgi:TetR/AcrR family transcriptional regulator, cholesterol catabolism regulator